MSVAEYLIEAGMKESCIVFQATSNLCMKWSMYKVKLQRVTGNK